MYAAPLLLPRMDLLLQSHKLFATLDHLLLLILTTLLETLPALTNALMPHQVLSQPPAQANQIAHQANAALEEVLLNQEVKKLYQLPVLIQMTEATCLILTLNSVVPLLLLP